MTYVKSKFSVLETATVPVRNPRNNVEYSLQFFVVEDGFSPLLGAKAAQRMDLIVVQHQNIMHPSSETSDHSNFGKSTTLTV